MPVSRQTVLLLLTGVVWYRGSHTQLMVSEDMKPRHYTRETSQLERVARRVLNIVSRTQKGIDSNGGTKTQQEQ